METNDQQDKKVETDFWDAEASSSKYEFFEKKVYSAFREKEYLFMIKKVITEYQLSTSAKILDLGCGAGVSTIVWEKLGFDATGVDISPALIQQAKELAISENSNAKFFAEDVSKLDLQEHSFDVCFMVGVLHHFPNYNPLLEISKRMLKDGGIIAAVEPNLLNWTYRLSFYLVGRKNGVTPNEFPLSPIETKKNMELYFHDIKVFQFREDDVPFLRQLGWWGRSYLVKILKPIILFTKNKFLPEYRRGTFFIITGKN